MVPQNTAQTGQPAGPPHQPTLPCTSSATAHLWLMGQPHFQLSSHSVHAPSVPGTVLTEDMAVSKMGKDPSLGASMLESLAQNQ